jgi:archaellum component FlaF (FlaF/FlaG flagellin family)
MAVKNNRKRLRRLFDNREGAAEIVGSIMFLLILLFFFTNVYLWHDSAARQMDDTLADKMNSPISIQIVSIFPRPTVVNVTNNGGVDVALSRLWIITSANHQAVDLEERGIWISPGETKEISGLPTMTPGVKVTFKILTTLGNTAACQYTP